MCLYIISYDSDCLNEVLEALLLILTSSGTSVFFFCALWVGNVISETQHTSLTDSYRSNVSGAGWRYVMNTCTVGIRRLGAGCKTDWMEIRVVLD